MHRISRWRKKEKTGRHLFLVRGIRKTVMPGDIIDATEQDLGNQIKHYERLDPAVREPEKEEQATGLQLVKVSRYTYNIVNPDNPKKPLNVHPLKKGDAEKFVKAFPTSELDWDQLVALMEERGIEILPEYENEDDLRQALIENNG